MTRHCETLSEDALVFHVRELGTAAYAVDSHHQIVFWNAAATQLLGYSSDAVIGRCCSEVLGAHRLARRVSTAPGCVAAATLLGHRAAQPLKLPVATFTCGQKVLCVSTFLAYAAEGDPRVVHQLHELTAGLTAELSPELPMERDPLDGREPEASSSGQKWMNGHMAPGGTTRLVDSALVASPLTPREHQVLRLLASGLATAEIARTLSISSITARNHITSVIEKLGVRTRLQAVLLASRMGLV